MVCRARLSSMTKATKRFADKPLTAKRVSNKKVSRYIKKAVRKNPSKWSTLNRAGGDE